MEEFVGFPSIKLINKGVVHKICSGQVILDLSSAIKELIENSLDAGATSIEISLKEYGEECFKVSDNGCGISPTNFQVLALKHHTSKLADFPDLQSLTTFGFRGEALSSLCALGHLSIETRTKNEPIGTHLSFDQSGVVTSERKTARQVGTAVAVEKLFSTLPVRRKEFSRNIRREYGKLIALLNAYAIISKGVRLLCTNSTGKNTKSVVLKTQGSGAIKDNIITVFGMNAFTCLAPLNASISESCRIEGFLSKPGNGSGRNIGDRQFFYVNGRPVDMPKVGKLLNELYRCANSKQYPIAILNFIMPTQTYDVNVTPDKRKIFFCDEDSLMLSLRQAIENIYSSSQCSYSIHQIDGSRKTDKKTAEIDTCEDEEPQISCSTIIPEGSEQTDQGNAEDSFMEDQTAHDKGKIPLSDPKYVVTLSACSFERSNSSHEKKQLRGFPSSSKSSSRSSFVQSSLNSFMTLTKRKRENTSLSELPVLRNEKGSCQGRKISSPTNTVISGSLLCHILGDNCNDDKDDREVKCTGAVNVSNEVETTCSAKPDIDDRSEDGNLKNNTTLLPQDVIERGVDTAINDATHTEPLMRTSDETFNGLSARCGSENCFILQFNLEDLKKRRKEWQSKLCSCNSSYEEMPRKRCYAAASLEISQMEKEEGKEKVLAAATTELERLFRKQDFGRMKVIGQFNLGFIIGKLDKDLFIVDQHAADEKYNFERLSQSTILNQQPLLWPRRLELSPEEEIVVSIHMDIIRKNGFNLIEDMDAAPGHRYLLKTIPFSKNITFGVEDIKELISTLADSQGDCAIMSSYRMDDPGSVCPSRVRGMLASRACRSSVMIGDPLGRNEMQKILGHLAGLKSPWNCPHGRPTMRHLIDLTTVYPKTCR